jgi:starvation-inducible DNA-binding protein
MEVQLMEELIQQMKELLADTFAFRLKTHYYHWNIEGPDFAQYHKFLGKLYKEVDEAADQTAEKIRSLDSYAPGSFQRYLELATIQGDDTITSALEMLNRVRIDNDILRNKLKQVRNIAEAEKEFGLVNFLEGRLDVHDKHAWMLRSLTKNQ